MNKTEFVQAISDRCKVTYAEAYKFVSAFTEVVTETLSNGESVQIPGFGSFDVSKRDEREARNPKTGEKITVAAHTVPKFKAGKYLKESMNNK